MKVLGALKIFWHCLKHFLEFKKSKEKQVFAISEFLDELIFKLEKFSYDKQPFTLTCSEKVFLVARSNPLLILSIKKTLYQINGLKSESTKLDYELAKLYLTQLIKALYIFGEKTYPSFTDKSSTEILKKVDAIEQFVLRHTERAMSQIPEDTPKSVKNDFYNLVLKEFEKTNAATLSIKYPKKLRELFYFWRKENGE